MIEVPPSWSDLNLIISQRPSSKYHQLGVKVSTYEFWGHKYSIHNTWCTGSIFGLFLSLEPLLTNHSSYFTLWCQSGCNDSTYIHLVALLRAYTARHILCTVLCPLPIESLLYPSISISGGNSSRKSSLNAILLLQAKVLLCMLFFFFFLFFCCCCCSVFLRTFCRFLTLEYYKELDVYRSPFLNIS